MEEAPVQSATEGREVLRDRENRRRVKTRRDRDRTFQEAIPKALAGDPGRRIEKIRYTLKSRGKRIELDVYRKKLAGLKSAEVEFKTRKQANTSHLLSGSGKRSLKAEYKNANLAQRKRESISTILSGETD